MDPLKGGLSIDGKIEVQGLGGFGALFLDGRGRGLVPKAAGGLKS